MTLIIKEKEATNLRVGGIGGVCEKISGEGYREKKVRRKCCDSLSIKNTFFF